MLGQSAGASLSPFDRFLARTHRRALFLAVCRRDFSPAISLYDLPEPLIWKAAALLFGLPMPALLLTFQRRRIRATGKAAPLRIVIVFIGISSLSLLAMLGAVFSNSAYAAAAYASSITVVFITHCYAVVTALEVILSQRSGETRKD